MHDFQRDFIDFMLDVGVLTFGDFTTKSGRKTPYFVNTGLYRSGMQMATLGRAYADAIEALVRAIDARESGVTDPTPLSWSAPPATTTRACEGSVGADGPLEKVSRLAVLVVENRALVLVDCGALSPHFS